ncbi:hypothetical protein [Amycolatopsis azurea]|uniref:Phage tail fiber protein n=1 Tax=Amycolatopsis azurea DSM 43854 TaxID=1238180 RepID=M2PF24_9PSEU|nr:hypothetical protein [Amycolatopsis azurea]EMD22928.1 Phage tail fiber protein [Amycolatopsis azurea DSM 43854]OOC04291.1 hypothetical protein B0293_23840 [Amycolatopsis azurea DSM 43854]
MGKPWYVANSLDILLGQVNALAPDRSRVSDGSIGDADHSARLSDHNPNDYRNGAGRYQVCARDFTHDPGDLDGQWLADRLTGRGDARLKYVIWNRRIWTPGIGWKSYNGQNLHTHHVHVSVLAGARSDSTALWNLGAAGAPNPPNPPRPAGRILMTEDNMATLPAAMGEGEEVLAVPPDADVKIILASKSVIHGGHVYNWSPTPGQGTGGDPVRWRTEIQEGEAIPIPRGTSKVHIFYSCASPISVFIQAIA